MLPIALLTLTALVVVAYAVGVAMTRGKIPHGTSIGGVDVGGKTVSEAKALLRADLAGKADAPIPVTADTVSTTITPSSAGMTVDIDKSVDALGTTTMSPASILHGFGRGKAHDLVLEVDKAKLKATIAAIGAKVDRAVKQGSIHYDGVTPVAVTPQIGRSLDQTKSASEVETRFRSLSGGGKTIPLPVTFTQPSSSAAQVETALTQIAAPAVSGPLHLTYSGTTVDVPPATLAAVLTLTAGPDGSLTATADEAKVAATFIPLLGSVPAVKPTNAKIALVDGKPQITPSVSATTPDPVALTALVPAAVVSASRTVAVPGKVTDPDFTTADAEKLGVKEVVNTKDPNGGATPHPCCRPRVHNITLIAGIVNNAIVLPGQVFDLNTYVGQRTAARGFVPAPEIAAGAEKEAVGGGVSQFATTMFNAAYFSGMKILQHQPHSFWISRYPPGREATVSWPEPDLRWQNNTPYGVLVQSWDDGNHTHVQFWSTQYWDVAYSSSPQTNVTQPGTTYETPDEISGKQKCVATVPEQGFDITIYRTNSHDGVAQPQDSWFHRYIPQPLHICKPNPTLTPSPSVTPSGSGSPTGSPTGKPTGKPTTKPPATPTTKPSKTPTPTPSPKPTPTIKSSG